MALALAWSLLASLGACADDEGGTGFEDSDAGGLGTRSDASVLPRDGGVPLATVRFAHLAPDLGSLDLCYRTAGTSTFEGPVLGGPRSPRPLDAGDDGAADATAPLDASGPTTDAAPDGAAAAGLSFRELTRYLGLDRSGPLELAVVPSGGSCAMPIAVRTVTLDPGKLHTVVVLGRTGASDADASSDAGASGLGVVAFVDDRGAVAEKARVRFIHAALAPGEAALPLGVRAVAGKTSVLAERVEPRRATSSSTTIEVDTLGYATVDPVPPPASLAVSAAAPGASDASPAVAPWQSAPSDLELGGGSLHTGFLLLGEDASLEVLWCRDTVTSGELTSCKRVR